MLTTHLKLVICTVLTVRRAANTVSMRITTENLFAYNVVSSILSFGCGLVTQACEADKYYVNVYSSSLTLYSIIKDLKPSTVQFIVKIDLCRSDLFSAFYEETR